MKLTREQTLEIEKFGEYFYVNRPDASFILHKNDMPKNKEDLWVFKDWYKISKFWTDKYLASYREGHWDDFDDTKINQLQLLKTGKIDNLFRGSPDYDGFLRNVNNTPLLRKIYCEFWSSYYNLNALEQTLLKNKKWSNIEEIKTPVYNIAICGTTTLRAYYLPSQQELNKLIKSKKSFGHSHGLIHDFPYIRKWNSSNLNK